MMREKNLMTKKATMMMMDEKKKKKLKEADMKPRTVYVGTLLLASKKKKFSFCFCGRATTQ